MMVAHKSLQAITHLRAKRAGVAVGEGAHVSPGGRYLVSSRGKIVLGRGVLLGREHILEVQDTAEIHIGDNVRFHERVRIAAVGEARIYIHNDCFFHHDITIRAHSGIVIGENCIFAAYSYLSDHNHKTQRDTLIRSQGFDTEPIISGQDVWLGVGATLVKGASLGDGAVIAARAVVNRPVPAYEIWGGVPARRIGERK